MMEHNEFVVEFKDGTRDWIDPVDNIDETADTVKVYASTGYEYSFAKSLISKFTVRPYNKDTTYDPI